MDETIDETIDETNEYDKNIKQTLKTVNNLFDKYKNDEYMLQRIYNHINVNLPNTLLNEMKNHEKKINLNTYLSEEQQIFIQVFLNKHNYYYLQNNNFYYEYDGINYYIVKEDEILHKLLSTISRERVLLKWKHKTKGNIIKQIKERNLFNTTPESDTIQNVLNSLYPYFFKSKNLAKYFLTIIGDNIFKKNNDLLFLVTNKMRQFLDELDIMSLNLIGINNITNRFITKYHENHSFSNCRLININENFKNDYWIELLNKIGLNLLCVACHYSNRNMNSDNFLNTNCDAEEINYVNSLKNIKQINLVEKFMNDFIEITTEDYFIEWKNLHFIWKQFLFINEFPNVIYLNSLKNILKGFFKYDENKDCFIGITSKYLPICRDFIEFWNETIVVLDEYKINENQNDNKYEDELEIDEIVSLFKNWNKNKYNLTEENIIKILKHFFNVEIIENKYILNIFSKSWNKKDDIMKSISFIKNEIKLNNSSYMVCFDDLYNYYQKYCKLYSLKNVVSKRYFEKFLYYKFNEYVIYEKFIKISWVNIS